MYELITLYTKNVHFTFNNKVSIQNHGVAMGSPFELVLINIFIVEIETFLIPNLSSTLSSLETFCWWYYLFCEERLHQIFSRYLEEEIDEKIPFLDAQVVRNNHVNTAVTRNKTNNNIYLKWKSIGTNSWKWGTLRTINTRAFEISSTNKFLQE